MSSAVVIGAATRYQEISVFDESTHIDYADRLAHGDLVRRGDVLSQGVLHQWSCRGFWNGDVDAVPACSDGRYQPSDFPALGINYNYFHPPTYYAATGVAARVLAWGTPVDDFVYSERLIGVLWLAGGMLMTYALARELDCDERVALGAAVGAALLPTVILQSSTVTNDSAALLAGAVVMWIGVRSLRRPISPLVVGAVGFGAASLKVVFGVASVVPVLLMAGTALQLRSDRRRARQLMLSSLFLLGSVLVVQYGWNAVQDLRALPGDYVNPVRGVTGYDVRGVPVRSIGAKAVALLAPTRSAFIPPDVSNAALSCWQWLSAAVLASASFGALLLARSARQRWFALCVLVAASFGGVIVATQFYLGSHQAMRTVNPRYALCLVPGFLVCVGIAVQRTRGLKRAALGGTVVGALIVVGSYTFGL